MFFGHNLSRSINPYVLSDGVAAGQNDTQTSSVLDKVIDGAVMFSIVLGTVASGGSGFIKVQASNDNGVTDPFTDLAGTGISYTNANSGQGFIIDLYQPQKRYFQVVIVRNSGSNTTIASITAFLYHLRFAPEGMSTTFGTIGWLSNAANGAA